MARVNRVSANPELRAAILREAAELEAAGSNWQVGHVAAFTGYSESFIGRMNVPRLVDRDTGRVFYKPSDVRAWYAARLTARAI